MSVNVTEVVSISFFHFSENPPSLDRLEETLELGSSSELCTDESPFLLLELPLLDLLDDGLLEPDSMGV